MDASPRKMLEIGLLGAETVPMPWLEEREEVLGVLWDEN